MAGPTSDTSSKAADGLRAQMQASIEAGRRAVIASMFGVDPAPGPTSDQQRHLAAVTAETDMAATLAEVREFYVPVPQAWLLDAALEHCRAQAAQWLEARGLDAEVSLFTEHSRCGARVSVIIGRQDSADATRDDQGGVPWRWSGRWTHWADKLAAMRRASAPMLAAQEHAGEPVDFCARLAQREAQASTGPVGPW